MTVHSSPRASAQVSDIDPTIGRRTATDPRQHFRMAIGSFTDPGKLADITDPIERMLTKALHAACIDWSMQAGSDGHVVLEEVCRDIGLPYPIGKNLIAHGMCHQADHDCLRCPQPRAGHVYVHDLLEHNRAAAQTAALSAKRRAAAAASHEKRWGARAPQPALQGPKRQPGRPRKHPLPEPATAPLEGLPAASAEPAAAPHPAEARARTRRRAPKEPRIFEAWVIEAANALADGIARNDPNGVRPNVTDTWLNDIRLTHEIDKREPEKIMKAIEWSQNHQGSGDFSYASIIKSPKNLRKHFAAMHSRAIKEHQRGIIGGVRRATSQPAALITTGMAEMLARQMSSRRVGMIKGA